MMSAAVKQVVVVEYSQTGQLSDVVSAVIEPLQASQICDVRRIIIEPVKAYPYPWDFFSFMDVFPESVYLDAPAIKPIDLESVQDADLVIIAYQVWFLSPSLPITAFMQSAQAKNLLHDKPVITLIACRNMWVMAQETMKKMIHDAGGVHIDNIALTDQGSSLASFVTTPRWLLTGKRNAFWGFPPAGVSADDIQCSRRFGQALAQALNQGLEINKEPLLTGLQAAKTDISLIQSEKIGLRSFKIWGKLIRKAGHAGSHKRRPVLIVYLIFLLLLIVTVVPVSMLLKRIMAPFRREKHLQIQRQYELPSGAGSERMGEFPCL